MSKIGAGMFGGGQPLQAEYVDTGFSASDLSSYTFANLDLGAAATNRYILVAAHGVDNSGTAGPSVTSMTVAGQTMTKIAGTEDAATYFHVVEWWIGLVPSGVQGDVVVNWSENLLTSIVRVYRVVNLKSITPHVIVQGILNFSPTRLDFASLSVPKDGALFGSFGSHTVASGVSFGSVTWDPDADVKGTTNITDGSSVRRLHTGYKLYGSDSGTFNLSLTNSRLNQLPIARGVAFSLR